MQYDIKRKFFDSIVHNFLINAYIKGSALYKIY